MNLNEIGRFPEANAIPRHKRILLLLTGGYDSTYILHRCLNIAHVDVVYMKSSIVGNKAKYEERAIDAILTELQNYHTEYTYKVFKVLKPDPEVCIGGMQDPQAAHWPIFTAGIYNPDMHDCIVLGYNYDDCGNSNVESVVKLWELTFKVAWPTNDNVKLYLPLLHTYKRAIIDGVPDYLAKHVWTCEGVTFRSEEEFLDACCDCNKCQELMAIMQIHPRTADKIFLQLAHRPLWDTMQKDHKTLQERYDWVKSRVDNADAPLNSDKEKLEYETQQCSTTASDATCKNNH